MTEDQQLRHPSPEALARYVDGDLSVAARHDIERHLVQCRSCRLDVMTAGAARRGSRRRWLLPVAVGLPAAAAIATLMLTDPFASRAPSNVLRVDNQANSSFIVRQPQEGATLTNTVHLMWSMPSPDARFGVTVTDATGATIIDTTIADTTLSIPIGTLSTGIYLWFVDALFDDGRSTTTGVHRFTIR